MAEESQEVKINESKVELDSLKQSLKDRPAIVITVVVNPVTGQISLAQSQLSPGHEAEELNMFISALGQVQDVARKALEEAVVKQRVQEEVSKLQAPKPAANGAAEPEKVVRGKNGRKVPKEA